MAEPHVLRERGLAGPGERATGAQHAEGELTARERSGPLLDRGSFSEVEQSRRHRAQGFGPEAKKPCTNGVATVEGRAVFVYAHDFRILGGAPGEVHATKIHEVMGMAIAVGAPLVSLKDAAGVRRRLERAHGFRAPRPAPTGTGPVTERRPSGSTGAHPWDARSMTGSRDESDVPEPGRNGFGGAAALSRAAGEGSVFSSSRYVARRQPTVADAGPRPPALTASAVQEVLDGLPGSAIFLVPLTGADGEVQDFRIAAASPDALDVGGRRGKELVGLSVLETYPSVLGTALWRGYLDVLEHGVRYEGEPFAYEEVLAGIPRLSRFTVHANACQGGLIVSWVRLDSGEREQRRLEVMQRLGNMGWANWDLVRDAITWSEQVYDIFARDPSLGPMTLEELPAHVLTEDLPALAGQVRRLLGDGQAIDHTFRITTPHGEVRHLRIVAEAEADAHGSPVEVHGFFQDMTAVQRAKEQLLERDRTAVAQQETLTAERVLAARLQHALLPLPQQSLRLAGLTVDAAYQPLQQGINVGGDWYSAIELPDGSALLVVGDVAGHGLDAVATMAQLRFTAKGMAITGTPLATILARLNTLLWHSADRAYSTATMIMCRYEPSSGILTWVQAGHLPPLLLRDGEARYLPSPRGVLLGATTAPRYDSSAIRLLPGDHLLFFTDGLVEAPGELLDDGLDRLARTVAERGAGPRPLGDVLDALVDPATRRDDICVLHVGV
ncbi:SpoIIE family protein phosphatase [Streptomyces sp. S1]|uniref:SpoIIE family protein phosphatase n=1 Tax=Streptomyces sp. S1 TaxID=718288 RepID=UPI000EF7CEC8|nr:SpoIIE family protein phosphatase [Streptomyces sp. S1]